MGKGPPSPQNGEVPVVPSRQRPEEILAQTLGAAPRPGVTDGWSSQGRRIFLIVMAAAGIVLVIAGLLVTKELAPGPGSPAPLETGPGNGLAGQLSWKWASTRFRISCRTDMAFLSFVAASLQLAVLNRQVTNLPPHQQVVAQAACTRRRFEWATNWATRGNFGATSNGLPLRRSGSSRDASAFNAASVNPVPTRPA